MKSFSERMIQQIDTLSSIATEFSNFAKMPKSNIREVDLIKIIDMVHNQLPLDFKVFIVQPSISKAMITEQQLTLLGVTENYLKEKALINLEVICS